MAKFLLISVVVAFVAIPAVVAREANPRRGLRKALAYTLVYELFYLFALRFILPRL